MSLDKGSKCEADFELLSTLFKIHKYGPTRLDRGICLNVLSMCGKSHKNTLRTLFRQWPEFSGIDEHPIEGSYNDAVFGGYMWNRDHPYGQARWRLLEYLILKLRVNHDFR